MHEEQNNNIRATCSHIQYIAEIWSFSWDHEKGITET
jgi:hypothetical protein